MQTKQQEGRKRITFGEFCLLSIIVLGAATCVFGFFYDKPPEYLDTQCKLVFQGGECLYTVNGDPGPVRRLDCNTRVPETRVSSYRDGMNCYYLTDVGKVTFDRPVDVRSFIVSAGLFLYIFGSVFLVINSICKNRNDPTIFTFE